MDARLIPGSAARPGEAPDQVYQRLIADDIIVAPDTIRQSLPAPSAVSGVDKSRYYDPAFHTLEMERMWSRTWQMACREEEIPEVGDVLLYEIGDLSFMVTRVSNDEIRAYRNACLHRGTRLAASDTSVSQFRCPFHGFTWRLDGTLKDVPCRWDFPHVDDERYRLPEAQVARWGGFVFLNPDPSAPSLAAYMGVLPDHVSGEIFANKYIAHYFRKVLPANWKACLEAFLEAYHSLETHPQGLPFTNDANAQYDVFPGSNHVSRFMHAFGVQSPHLAEDLSEQAILDEIYRTIWGDRAPELPTGEKARPFAARMARERKAAETGHDYSTVSDAEALDSIEYTLFPNLILFRGLLVPLVYRFRPHGNDPDQCVFDLILLADTPANGARPEAAPVFEMGDMAYRDLTQMGPFFGMVYDQDTGNLAAQQKGLKTMLQPELTLARYQESRIRHFEGLIDAYVAGGPHPASAR